ncbi:hypothetical protein HZC30_01510 [Candidatus Woesearchaeota archaeon]|nr:hypothetical protein [Candidatus Woesearchaeota archaeon]
MVLLRKKPERMAWMSYSRIDDAQVNSFIELMNIIKTEAGRTAQEFRGIQVYKQNSQRGDEALFYTKDRVEIFIDELNSFRKHLLVAGKRTPEMIAMLNRATH